MFPNGPPAQMLKSPFGSQNEVVDSPARGLRYQILAYMHWSHGT